MWWVGGLTGPLPLSHALGGFLNRAGHLFETTSSFISVEDRNNDDQNRASQVLNDVCKLAQLINDACQLEPTVFVGDVGCHGASRVTQGQRLRRARRLRGNVAEASGKRKRADSRTCLQVDKQTDTWKDEERSQGYRNVQRGVLRLRPLRSDSTNRAPQHDSPEARRASRRSWRPTSSRDPRPPRRGQATRSSL